MSFWLVLFPFVSALLGWCCTKLAIKMLFHPQFPKKILGGTVQGYFPKRRFAFSASAGNLLRRELDSFQEIEKKILDPSNLQKIMPEIEEHIDYFLRIKLKDAMPMVAMFVGDKTIVQLKEVFMTEMQTLFPVIMESYVKELKKNLQIDEIIIHKLDSVPGIKIELFFLRIFRKEFRHLQLLGALFGFVTGALQIIITLLINR
ncbi:MAG: DUF445 domain-containing protein [Chitinophagaceae bacterium]